MKKTIFTLLLLLGLCAGVSAAEQAAAPAGQAAAPAGQPAAPAGQPAAPAGQPAAETTTVTYECLMITIWSDSPECQISDPTYGVKIGILGCGGAPVYGVEGAVIRAASDKVYGFKGALGYTVGQEACGFLLAPFNAVKEFSGLEIAAVNVADKGGFQIGLLNFMKNGFLPCFPLINFSL